MHVVVMGAGAVGGYFGARLARAGTRVTFVARGPHLEALRRDGLRVRSTVEGDHTVRAPAVGTPGEAGPADAVLFCVKAYDTEAAAAALRPIVGADTPVLSLQNGVDSEERIDAALGPAHALGGVAQVFAAIEAPGVIAHHALGRIIFGELDGRRTARAERLRAAFEKAQVPVELTPDIRRALWEKYAMICAVAGTTALTRASIGVVRETPETWRLFQRLLEEVTAVGRAAGVALPADTVERVRTLAGRIPPGNRASLAQDLRAGRPLELEALHGYAVRLGERLGVPTPMLFAVYAGLKPHAAGARD
jgi:2-dehydropantoate 2-reductase